MRTPREISGDIIKLCDEAERQFVPLNFTTCIDLLCEFVQATVAIVAPIAAKVLQPDRGIGDAVGVPRTDETACAQALREGRTWDASFACPASDFIAGVFAATTPATSQVATSQNLPQYLPAARDSVSDLFLDPYGYSNPI